MSAAASTNRIGVFGFIGRWVGARRWLQLGDQMTSIRRRDSEETSDCVGRSLSCKIFGAVAQLGEHLVCNQGVAGSIPVRSIDPK